MITQFRRKKNNNKRIGEVNYIRRRFEKFKMFSLNNKFHIEAIFIISNLKWLICYHVFNFIFLFVKP